MGNFVFQKEKMAIKKNIFGVFFLLPLLGSGCLVAQRPHTFIPPTSPYGECGTIEPYFYSTIYQFCIGAPNDNWSRVSVSLPMEILGTDIITFSFFSVEEDQKIFTLYISEPSEDSLTLFQREQIPVIHQEPYIVGYTLNPDTNLPPDLQNLQPDVEEMVKNMTFKPIALQ